MKKLLLLLTIMCTLSANAMDKAKLKVGPVKTKIKADGVTAEYKTATNSYVIRLAGSSKNEKKLNSYAIAFPLNSVSFEKGQVFPIYQDLGDPSNDDPKGAATDFTLRVIRKNSDTLYGVSPNNTLATGQVKVKSFNEKTRVLKLNVKSVARPVLKTLFNQETFDILSSEEVDMKISSKAQIVVTLPEATN